MRRRDRFSISSIRLADLGSPLSAIDRSKLLRCLCYDARFVIAPLGQDRPRDARQLVSERFLVCFGDLVAVVPSPELLLSGSNRHIATNPLAGTRPRGTTPAEDTRLRAELAENHKEIVEHVVSVNTVLSELEPICARDSLVVSRFMDVAQLRRVQHLSSTIRGSLAAGYDVLDALWALFPAVTVTGLPKSPAIKVIERLEDGPRYLYGGVMGWVSGADDCRFSPALRGLYRCGNRSFLQAGAGILAESVPEAELLETTYKLSAMKDALASAVWSSEAAMAADDGEVQ